MIYDLQLMISVAPKPLGALASCRRAALFKRIAGWKPALPERVNRKS